MWKRFVWVPVCSYAPLCASFGLFLSRSFVCQQPSHFTSCPVVLQTLRIWPLDQITCSDQTAAQRRAQSELGAGEERDDQSLAIQSKPYCLFSKHPSCSDLLISLTKPSHAYLTGRVILPMDLLRYQPQHKTAIPFSQLLCLKQELHASLTGCVILPMDLLHYQPQHKAAILRAFGSSVIACDSATAAGLATR